MISTLEKKIILRFLLAKKKEGFVNIISIFSFIGITLGVAILIIVMSVMNGFRSELTNKIIGFNAHIVIKPYDQPIDFKKLQEQNFKSFSDQILISNTSEGVIINKDYTKGILLRGYKRNDFKKLNLIRQNKLIGNKNLNSKHISIGKELSLILNVDIGDKIILMSPYGVDTIVGSLPKQEAYIIDSIFESGLFDFDQNVAFINIGDLENLFNLNEGDRIAEIYVNNHNNVDKIKNILLENFNNNFIYTWKDLNKSLFSALKIERNVMFIILTLIIVVAAFNIISGLTILVKNKTKEIAILKSIGVNNASIRKIFFLIGLIIGFTATLTGIIIGVLFSLYVEEIRIFLSEIFNISIFPEEIYFLSKMPSQINFFSIFIIGVTSIVITSLVSIYPAIKASKLDTIKALKYE